MKTHYLGLWGKHRKLYPFPPRYAVASTIEHNAPWIREAWVVTGSANVDEARRRVARVKAGAPGGDPGVRRLK